MVVDTFLYNLLLHDTQTVSTREIFSVVKETDSVMWIGGMVAHIFNNKLCMIQLVYTYDNV